MTEPRWPDDIPPPHAELHRLGERCLGEVNDVARQHPWSTPLEHELLEIARSQAIAIGRLAKELLRLRGEIATLDDDHHRGVPATPAMSSIAR